MIRPLLAALHPALWIAWGIYWKLSSVGVKDMAREESRAQRFRHFGPLILAVLLFTNGRHFPMIFPWTFFTYAIGTLVLIAGLLFSVWARVVLGRNWSATVAIKQDHELIQSGPYRWVRHPIYTGMLVGFIGSAIAQDRWSAVLAVALVFVGFWFKLLREEVFMRETFGEKYDRYCAHTTRLIPFVL